ncbi:hypothetical protein [Salipiger sp.]|uniref:hypothetical protein n=1 Tax=Salipiger sp. TaxID=2078585 RepID=UPI003A97162F
MFEMTADTQRVRNVRLRSDPRMPGGVDMKVLLIVVVECIGPARTAGTRLAE